MKTSRMRILAAWLCLLLLTLALPAGPQATQSRAQSSAPAPQQQQTVLRVTTRLVQVNVIVQDRKGEPVGSLGRDDFTLLEDGKPQPISVFMVEANQVKAAPAPLPPNTFSNQFERRAGIAPSLTAILFDGLNTKFEDQAYARQQIIKFLKQLHPEDRVAIYALGRDLRLLHDFTSDTESLLRVLNRHKGNIASELAASEETIDTGPLADAAAAGDEQAADLERFLNEANETMQAFYVDRRVERTMDGIEAIANHLTRLPGRKNLIWVSGGFPYTFGMDEDHISRELRNYGSQIERTTRAVNNANLAIYPVDARGLIGAFEMYPQLSASARGSSSRQPPAMKSNASKIWQTQASMEELADRTGGRAFLNSNDLKGAIRQAIDDSRLTYLLGYYPRHGNWDGTFHEIKVQVKPHGLHVRHRRGYIAYPDVPRDEKSRQEELRIAAWSSLDATGLGMTVKLVPQRTALGPSSLVKLEITLSPREVTLE